MANRRDWRKGELRFPTVLIGEHDGTPLHSRRSTKTTRTDRDVDDEASVLDFDQSRNPNLPNVRTAAAKGFWFTTQGCAD